MSEHDTHLEEGLEPEDQSVNPSAQDESVAEAPEAEAHQDTETVSVDELLAKLAAAEQTIEDQKDSVLRAAAEEQNVRRRAQRDVESAHKFALEKFAKDLLPVVDTLERALDAGNESDNEGIQLTLKMLTDTLQKHGVETVDPVGTPFDPQQHEAMSMQPNPDMEPNTVMAVLQKGYALNERLIRPAMVIVAKAP